MKTLKILSVTTLALAAGSAAFADESQLPFGPLTEAQTFALESEYDVDDRAECAKDKAGCAKTKASASRQVDDHDRRRRSRRAARRR